MSEFRPEIRALMQAGRAVLLPTPADRERVFAALAVRLGFTTELPPPALATAKAGAGWQAISALAVGVVFATLATYTALFARQQPSLSATPLAVTAPAAAPATAGVPVASFPIEAPTVAVTTAVPASSPAANTSKVREHRADSLSEEVALLGRAETELHAGRSASALKLLDEHVRTFPHGVLVQERIAARVHALCGLGRISEANAELARITPGSLQESSAREACGGVTAR
jgi:hypothetical protein